MPPGTQDAYELVDRLDVGRNVLEDLRCDDPIELTIGEGQRQRVALLDVSRGALGDLAGFLHRAEQVQHVGQLVGVLVERDDVGTAAVHLERVPTGTRTHVNHSVARLETEPVEINCQHACSSPRFQHRGLRRVGSDHFFVCGCRGLGHRAPAEHLEHTLASGLAHRLAALGVVEQLGDRRFELSDVTGSHERWRRRRPRRRPRGSLRRG